MYYILAIIFFVIVYVALTKVLSSIFKGCLLTLGIAILCIGGYYMYKSTQEPVIIFDRYVIDNFEVIKFNKGIK